LQKRIQLPQPQSLQQRKCSPAAPSVGLRFLPTNTTGTSYWTSRQYKNAGIALNLTPKLDELIVKEFYTAEQLQQLEELTATNYNRLIKLFTFPEVPQLPFEPVHDQVCRASSVLRLLNN